MSASVTGIATAPTASEAPSWLKLGWLTLLYVALGYLGLHFDDGDGLVSAVWPASGVGVAVVLRYGNSGFWVPLLGNLILMVPMSMLYGQPLIVARDEQTRSTNERDFAQLTAVEVNRMGERRLYLVAVLWTSAQQTRTEQDEFSKSFERVELRMGEHSTTLARHRGAARARRPHRSRTERLPGDFRT